MDQATHNQSSLRREEAVNYAQVLQSIAMSSPAHAVMGQSPANLISPPTAALHHVNWAANHVNTNQVPFRTPEKVGSYGNQIIPGQKTPSPNGQMISPTSQYIQMMQMSPGMTSGTSPLRPDIQEELKRLSEEGLEENIRYEHFFGLSLSQNMSSNWL